MPAPPDPRAQGPSGDTRPFLGAPLPPPGPPADPPPPPEAPPREFGLGSSRQRRQAPPPPPGQADPLGSSRQRPRPGGGSGDARHAPLGASGQDARHAPFGASGQDARHAAMLGSGADLRPAPGEPPALSSSLVGKRVGPYRITSLIAQGGMGAVYEATHERLHRAVALKTLLGGQGASSEDVQRFLNEARAAARLSHPNLVQIHDVGEQAGVRYLAMELVRGETLHSMIRRGGVLDEAQALRIVADAARGLAHAHGQGVLHRDLKPANILLGPDGVPRLTDFGVAKAVGNQSLTATGTALGTPSYMSPEQAMGHNDALDARTDVWGLGAILYECLTGRPPFELGTHLQTMQAVVSDPAVPPSELRPGLAPEVEAICLKCLNKKREERYPSCEALIEDCERFLAGRTVQARAPTRLGLLLRRAQRQAGALAVAGALALGVAAAALAAARPALDARRARAAAEAAVAGARARLAAARDAAGAGALDRAAVEAAAALDPAALRAAALDAAAPGQGPGRAAAEAALAAADLDAEVDAVVAAAHLRLAAAAAPDPAPVAGPALAHLLEASLADPEGPAGREARLRLARALAARDDDRARELARAELLRLAAGDDAPARLAAVDLALALAAAGRWGQALEAAARAEAGATPPAPAEASRLALVGPLARALGAASALPPAAAAALTRGAPPALLLAGAGRVWRQRVEAPAAPDAPLAPSDGGARRAPGQLAALLAGDWDGDGRDEALLVEARGSIGVGRIEADPTSWLDWSVRAQAQQPVHAAAAGDVDGDGRTDVLVSFLEERGASFVALGGRRGADKDAFLRLPPGAQPGYVNGRVALADLDGDGRDELVLGGTPFEPGLEVLTFDPAQRALVSAARLALGPVRSLVVHAPAPGERREGVVVAVDAGRDDPPPTLAAGGEPDGLYLVEQPAGAARPAVVARWTYGDPADAAGRARASDVVGAVVTIERRPWVVRAARVDGRPRLDLAPRDGLGGGAAPPALTVELPAAALTPAGAPRALVGDLDGDGDEELVLGGLLLGLGAPRRAGLELPPPGPRRSGPAELLRAVRAAYAHGDDALGAALAARLGARHPGSTEAAAAALAGVDALLARAAAAARAAEAAFARLDAEAGRRARGDAVALASRAAQLAAEAGATGPEGGRAEALARAAWAWGLADEPARAAAALEAALAHRDLGPDVAARLRDDLAAARRSSTLEPLALELGRPEARAALCVRHPLRVTADRQGVALACAADVEGWVVAPVEVERPLPLVLEAVVRTTGAAWAARAEVGAFARGPDDAPGALTGVSVSLWDVHSGRIGVQAVVGGRPAGALVRLPSAVAVLRVRLEVTPRPDGALRARLRVRDRDDVLLLDQTVDVDAPPPPGALLLGLRGARYPEPEVAFAEQLAWPGTARVVLERVRLEAGHPALEEVDPDDLDVPAAHAALAFGEVRAAREAYDELVVVAGALGAATAPEVSLARALARARAGEAGAEAEAVAAVRLAPYSALLWLEDALADEVLEGLAPADVELLAATLRALSRDADPVVAAVGRSLRGDPAAGAGLTAAAVRGEDDDPERELAALYVTLRAPEGPTRWAGLPRYRELAPDGRLPRRLFPPCLEVPEGPDAERAADALGRDPSAPPQARYRALVGLRALHPQAVDVPLYLAQTYGAARLAGQAAAVLRRGLERGVVRGDRVAQAQVMLAAMHLGAGRADEAQAALQAAREAGATPQQLEQVERSLRARGGGAAEGR